jgi:hypothetical protein
LISVALAISIGIKQALLLLLTEVIQKKILCCSTDTLQIKFTMIIMQRTLMIVMISK